MTRMSEIYVWTLNVSYTFFFVCQYFILFLSLYNNDKINAELTIYT